MFDHDNMVKKFMKPMRTMFESDVTPHPIPDPMTVSLQLFHYLFLKKKQVFEQFSFK
jgi:hypothetical protein